MKIIGREEETKILDEVFKSNNAEFLALYGRRRVGKTFLIKNYFKGKKVVFFFITGEKDAPMNQQIAHFTKQISDVFYEGVELLPKNNWDETFDLLTKAINKKDIKSKKIILFFDEFPWMATRNSKLLQNLDYYWNQYWVDNDKLKLIICGSAASWIINNIVNNKGGLHNRITRNICLEPLKLPATKNFLKANGVMLDNKHIVDLYMSMGGVPYYLKQIKPGQSSTQIIESLAFRKNGFLLAEFNNLFASLFKDGEIYEEIIRNIASRRYGIGKKELLKAMGKNMVGKGGLEKLNALKQAGFIMDFKPHSHKEKGIYYKLIDNYTLFYLYWIAPVYDTLLTKSLAKGYWSKMKKMPTWRSWSGLAFESICHEHIPQIMNALDLSPSAIPSTWRYVPRNTDENDGAQIDLLFDRDDDVITLCEIKYTENLFTITKDYAENLKKKVEVYRKITRTNKQLFITLISANGVKVNKYSKELISGVVTLDDLFKDIQ